LFQRSSHRFAHRSPSCFLHCSAHCFAHRSAQSSTQSSRRSSSESSTQSSFQGLFHGFFESLLESCPGGDPYPWFSDRRLSPNSPTIRALCSGVCSRQIATSCNGFRTADSHLETGNSRRRRVQPRVV
jgi:hypothetical protein